MKKPFVIILSSLIIMMSTYGLAQLNYISGSAIRYTKSKDPITDLNTSAIYLPEVHATTRETYFSVKCSAAGKPQLWSLMASKHEMMTANEYLAGVKPLVQIRLGEDPPLTLDDNDMTSVSRSGDYDGQSLGFAPALTQHIATGLSEGKRLVVRVYRSAGGQPLTYTYSANGFAQAWAAVNGCGVPGTVSRGASRVATKNTTNTNKGSSKGSSAPKLTRWYFTTCRDEKTGKNQTGLVAGQPARCELVVETVPNGATLTSARFRYELEYQEGGRKGKLKLDGVDYWPASAYSGVAEFSKRGNNLVFQLPLAVRARTDRVYTSINVTGELNFGGDIKRVYEPLPVRLR